MTTQTQATPVSPTDDGPTDCIHCGERIRRFGQTRRWCHDRTGDVQCVVCPEGPGYSREARAHTRSDQPHRAPAEDEAAVEQLLGTLARYEGHVGPRDARNYAASVLDMARGHRGITPAKLVEMLELCPNGRWHFVSDCPEGCVQRREAEPPAGTIIERPDGSLWIHEPPDGEDMRPSGPGGAVHRDRSWFRLDLADDDPETWAKIGARAVVIRRSGRAFASPETGV